MRDSGIDKHGLDKTDRKYLRRLSRCEKSSVESLALYLGQDAEYVRRQIEPQLLRHGLIAIGAGGRTLTERGRAYTQQTKPEKG